MPWIIDYQMVLEQMRGQNLKCLYYNSGAFGFVDASQSRTLAWVGPEDSTIKPNARPFTRQVAEPYEPTLARMASRFWQEHLPGRVWAMPMSHWAYELDHGSKDWLPAVLENMDLDPGLLATRNNAAAIEFSVDEIAPFEHFTERLLMMLGNSDFMLAFPGRQVLCTVHHHKQLWWTTTEAGVIEAVEAEWAKTQR